MGLAFGAGLVAVLNPCGFAMLPVYMTLVVRGDATGQLSALRRAVVATIEMVRSEKRRVGKECRL